MSKPQQKAVIDECFTYDNELLQKGHWLDGGQALQGVRTAKTLRWKNGNVVVTDGPFAETKEQLGGIGVLEARDMDHAVELMSKHPGVRIGPFEIRPIDGELTERCKPDLGQSTGPSAGAEFICLGYGDENKWNAMTSRDREAMINEYIAYDEVLRTYGESVGGVALQSIHTAKTLRSSCGQLMVTDGPYAETKEQLGGVAIYRFANMERAVEVWSNHPCLRMGDVLELRPSDEEFNARWEATRGRRMTDAQRPGVTPVV